MRLDTKGATYTVPELRCANCNWKQGVNNKIAILRGHRIADKPCPKCGCYSLTRRAVA